MIAALILALSMATEPPAPALPPQPAPVAGPPRPSAVQRPNWVRRPSPDDIARVYPDAARKARLGGKITLTCKVLETGLLDACGIVQEDPEGMGFGEAALKIARLYRMKPVLADGAPVTGGVVRIPVVFAGPPPNVDEAAACYGELVRHNRRIPDDDMARPWQGRAEAYAYQVAPREGVTPKEVGRRLAAAAALPDDGSTSLKHCWDLL